MNDKSVSEGIVQMFEAAAADATAKAEIERVIADAFQSVGEPKPGATPEELSQRWEAIFEHMWRGFGCNVIPFPDRSGGSGAKPEGGEA